MGTPIKYAYQPSTGRAIHIDHAANGLDCLCTCEKCGDRLEAIQGKIKDWHFRHSTDKDCGGAPMTTLHRMAEQIMLESAYVDLPEQLGRLRYARPTRGGRVGPYCSDIVVEAEGEQFYFEILVTSECSPEKERYYVVNQHKSIEIDLSEIDHHVLPADLVRLVLEDKNNRRVIFWAMEQPAVIKRPEVDWGKIVSIPNKLAGIVVLSMVGLIGGIIWYRQRRKRKKRRRARRN